MAKIKFRQILLWGWKGINVWSVLVSLGVPAVLRAALHNVFNEWIWYDQLLLFGGAGLIILGILIFIFRGRWLGAKTESGNEQRELLDFYRQQKANWKGNIRLKIVRVTQDIAGDVPKVIFWLEMINYLPVKFKLIKVTHSSGTVSAGEFGSCLLPSLPETIDKTINPCSENEFKLEMPVHGTRVPNFLSNVSVAGQLLQWMLKGEWYIEIYSKLEVWQYQSYQITYNQIIATSEVVKRRERE